MLFPSLCRWRAPDLRVPTARRETDYRVGPAAVAAGAGGLQPAGGAWGGLRPRPAAADCSRRWCCG